MVMEASSQSLKYERVGNTHFDTAIFLNISRFTQAQVQRSKIFNFDWK